MFFLKIKLDWADMMNGVYETIIIIKTISFFTMIASAIAVIIMW